LVLDPSLQERAWNLGESLVAEVCDPARAGQL
jgi:hypothetical protein